MVIVSLVHHAEAVESAVDPQRPLSSRGQAQAVWLAGQARERQFRPVTIWHSGKLRSRQTAEEFLRQCNPFAAFRAVRGLLPGDPTMWMENALALESDDVLVVGHLPQLPQLARVLGASDALPLHGMLVLERVETVRYVQRWMLAPP